MIYQNLDLLTHKRLIMSNVYEWDNIVDDQEHLKV